MTLICVIRSKVVPKDFDSVILEPGQWEVSVEVDLSEAYVSGDPKGFVQNQIAQHLAGCVRDTKLPLNEGLWNIAFTQTARSIFNFPEGFTA